ncbi:MAG: phosphatidate cytidylyltransferase [Defluviitaleaceae bacterium]|nr:phosphatidate cytidylyltransferase [Defluviitaleaceae bacterium]
MSSTNRRIISAAVALPVFVACLWFGGWLLAAGLTALAIVGVYEFMRAVISDKNKLFPQLNKNAKTVIYSFFSVVYIAFPLFAIFCLRETDGAMLSLVIIFIASWGCDTGAYFVGRWKGKKQLAPILSPKKTWGGAIGGTFIAVAAIVATAIIWSRNTLYWQEVLLFAGVGLIVVVAGQFGDLFASLIKRKCEIKDFGTIMPGHGGMLDRFDSILFVAPLVFISHFVLLPPL